MSKRNATASWSGYSHQGQVGLLIALRKLQEEGIDLANHFVQFETHEDVAIYRQDEGGNLTYLSVHQVKAYYSEGSHLKSAYQGVLNEDFEDGESKFLHTTTEIIDWDTSATANNNEIQRYQYSDTENYCDTTNIENFIKAELNTILSASEAVIDDAYRRLLFALDHRIREEHKKVNRNLYDIKFSLEEINELIRDEETFTGKEIYDCRKLFYETYMEVVKRVENIEQNRIDFIEEHLIKKINGLNDKDFRLLLQRMNLHRKPEDLRLPQVYYNQDGLKQVFFKLIFNVINCDPEIIESVVKYSKVDEASQFVLTTIIDEEDDKLEVVENILTNLDSQNLLWENHSLINRFIDIDLIDRNPSIKSIVDVDEQEDDKDKFMFYANSKLITREMALRILNDEGNN